MAGTTCPSCGNVNPPGAAFCLRCGNWLPQVVAPPPPPPGGAPLPPGMAAPPPAWLTPPRPEFVASVDGRALDRAQLAGFIGFVAGLVSPVLLFLVGPSLGLAVSSTANGIAAPSGTTLLYWSAAAALGVALSAVTWLLMWSAFTTLRGIDHDYATPSKLILVGLIGLVLIAIGAPLIFAGLGPLLQCTAAPLNQTLPTPTNNCLSTQGGELLEGVGIVFLGAIPALIGFIGLLLGIWRLGTRYDSSLLHIGAILAIFLPFVGWLLVWLGAREARRKVPESSVVPLGSPKV